jgi:hypothetical protein
LSIQALFEELDRDTANLLGGHLYRRLLPESRFDVRIEVRATDKHHRFVVGDAKGHYSQAVTDMKGLSVLMDEHEHLLVVELVEPRLSQLFTALVEDLLHSLRNLPPEGDPAEAVLDRLALWRRLFSDSQLDGLTSEEQRGLFCELCCLRDFALQALDASSAVASWVAPNNSSQDFRSAQTAIEVKSRFRKGNTRVRISSEEQLEHKDKPLFLVVYALDTGEGLSLNEMVDSLVDRLSPSTAAHLAFRDSLIRYGYLQIHRDRYAGPRYKASPACYRVAEDFPRIVRIDLRAGVTRVAYDIDLSTCVPFVVPTEDVIASLGGRHG